MLQVPAAPSLGRTLALSGLDSLVPLLVLLVAVVISNRQAAEAEARRGAERATDLLAVAVVEPALRDGPVRGGRALRTVARHARASAVGLSLRQSADGGSGS